MSTMFLVQYIVPIAATAVTLVMMVVLLLSLVYFCKPLLLVSLHTKWRMFRGGVTEKQVKAGGLSYAYLERGSPSNPTLLFIHGFMGMKENFLDLLVAISRDFHIIALDLPGHGSTTRIYDNDHSVSALVEKVHQFADALGLTKKKFHIIGGSMGGHISGVYAASFPNDLLSTMMMCPAGIEQPTKSPFVETILAGGRNLLIPESPKDFQDMIDLIMKKPLKLPYQIVKAYSKERSQHNQFFKKVLQEITSIEERFLLQGCLSDISVPALVIWGDSDQVLDVSCVDVIGKLLPSCQIEVIDAGHAISWERPYKTAKIIQKFINSSKSKSE